jgi:hypothetical protein
LRISHFFVPDLFSIRWLPFWAITDMKRQRKRKETNMKRMQGRIQTSVIKALGAKPMTTNELAMQIYRVVTPTLSQTVTVRRILARLAKDGIARESLVFTRDGVQCWVLANAQIREDPISRLRSV